MAIESKSLAEWLAWMEAHHPRQIELGLARVTAVATNLTLNFSGEKVITVGGTNGKGSCVAFLESILRAAGYRVGAYSSPHLMRYNERVRIDGVAVDDMQLCAAFSAVNTALGGISLTYFEVGTLAALWLFQRAQLDVVILEVGLGGRLDAVNIIDADVAVLTTIDLDHQDWLGPDRESIGAEKAGIFRAHKPAICVDADPPQSVIAAARNVGSHWYAADAAFEFSADVASWRWSGLTLPRHASYVDLPIPRLPLPSAAAALAALHCLELPINADAIADGLRSADLPGRFQRIAHGAVEIILDVAHNPQAARWLAQRLMQVPCVGRTLAVFAMMADKDIAAVIEALKTSVDVWYVGDLVNNARAASGVTITAQLHVAGIAAVISAPTLTDAYGAALAQAKPQDRIIVFGSFFTVAAVLALIPASNISTGGG